MRKKDQYNGRVATDIANALFQQNQKDVTDYAVSQAVQVLETAYREGYKQALKDYDIEVYPENITERVTIEEEED